MNKFKAQVQPASFFATQVTVRDEHGLLRVHEGAGGHGLGEEEAREARHRHAHRGRHADLEAGVRRLVERFDIEPFSDLSAK